MFTKIMGDTGCVANITTIQPKSPSRKATIANTARCFVEVWLIAIPVDLRNTALAATHEALLLVPKKKLRTQGPFVCECACGQCSRTFWRRI
jgi:hypothetical protein